jgi:hypothetical protein
MEIESQTPSFQQPTFSQPSPCGLSPELNADYELLCSLLVLAIFAVFTVGVDLV